MKLIIGLGNPGNKYTHNRHNAGFIILDELKKEWNFPDFSLNSKFDAEISEGNVDNKKIMLAKPQTFMNDSGSAVQKIMSFYKISQEDLIVIHDDLDIDFGNYKISEDSSSAGHNGVQDIMDGLGTQKLKRIRIGIEGTEQRKNRVVPGDVFVLQDFSTEELKTIKNLAKEIKI